MKKHIIAANNKVAVTVEGVATCSVNGDSCGPLRLKGFTEIRAPVWNRAGRLVVALYSNDVIGI